MKDQVTKLQLDENVKFPQQKSRFIPIQLQGAVRNGLVRLMIDNHIEKLSTFNDKMFIQPTVITVKKVKSVKIAMDARELSKSWVKGKHQ